MVHEKGQKTLDYIAIEAAYQMTEEIEDKDVQALEILVTKALGVLQSQGIYAMALFLLSRQGGATKKTSEQEAADRVFSSIRDLVERCLDRQAQASSETDQQRGEKEEFLLGLRSLELDQLLFLRELCEQALIYARYLAKAKRSARRGVA